MSSRPSDRPLDHLLMGMQIGAKRAHAWGSADSTKRPKTSVDTWIVLLMVLRVVRRLKAAVAAKWVSTLRLNRPASKERSFASNEKARFWNFRFNHWISPRMVAKSSNKKFWFDCTGCGSYP